MTDVKKAAGVSNEWRFSNLDIQRLESGQLVVDLSTLKEGADVTVIAGGANVQVQTGKPEASAAVDRAAFQIGDVLPSGPQKGWLIVSFNAAGSVKLLEPGVDDPKNGVTWHEAKAHEEALRKQGHLTARLWTENDGTEIIRNIIQGGHNDKARLDTTSSSRYGCVYWEDWETQGTQIGAMVCFADDGHRIWRNKDNRAHVRCVQDVPLIEL